MKLVIASNNNNKLKEIKAILGDSFDEPVTLRDAIGDVEIEETGKTFFENALIKAKTVSELSGAAAIGDDSGLMVTALDGAPGVYSARFAGEHGNDEKNNALLLEKLKDKADRSACFMSAVVLYYPDGTYVSAEGTVDGEILFAPRGTSGFGYDPLFYSYDLKKSFAEATMAEKNTVSHRSRALHNLLALINK